MELYRRFAHKPLGQQVSYDVVEEGDPDCQHVLGQWNVVTAPEGAATQFVCRQCGRVIRQPIEGIQAPITWTLPDDVWPW